MKIVVSWAVKKNWFSPLETPFFNYAYLLVNSCTVIFNHKVFPNILHYPHPRLFSFSRHMNYSKIESSWELRNVPGLQFPRRILNIFTALGGATSGAHRGQLQSVWAGNRQSIEARYRAHAGEAQGGRRRQLRAPPLTPDCATSSSCKWEPRRWKRECRERQRDHSSEREACTSGKPSQQPTNLQPTTAFLQALVLAQKTSVKFLS